MIMLTLSYKNIICIELRDKAVNTINAPTNDLKIKLLQYLHSTRMQGVNSY